ncbi:MAG: LacI family transcriptional regulator [Microbacteriaceae bacterium]|jgi:LacI family transcriptional regulator|nr:LacI family transcriptional regulator [Microbacteriaceae bacterium]
MVKISDVAREAGVSAATVSRALNQKPNVNPDYAERVREAAERLGYRPNGIARSLRRQSTNLLALIISDVANPFFTAVTRGVEDVAQQNGYSILLCNADEDAAKESTYLEVAEEHQVAGVVLSPHAANTDISRLASAGIPVVVIDRPLDAAVDSVLVNSFDGAKSATEHLLDEGWKRPACITGPADAETARQRLDGYLKAIEEYGGVEPMYCQAPFRQGGGRLAASQLLDSPEPPDALFVANSQMALGVLDELGRRGMNIGTDIGVITFDDAPWAPFVNSPLSVVAQPAYDIGAQAAQLLTERIRHSAPSSPRTVTLSTNLIVRESSRRTAA